MSIQTTESSKEALEWKAQGATLHQQHIQSLTLFLDTLEEETPYR